MSELSFCFRPRKLDRGEVNRKSVWFPAPFWLAITGPRGTQLIEVMDTTTRAIRRGVRNFSLRFTESVGLYVRPEKTYILVNEGSGLHGRFSGCAADLMLTERFEAEMWDALKQRFRSQHSAALGLRTSLVQDGSNDWLAFNSTRGAWAHELYVGRFSLEDTVCVKFGLYQPLFGYFKRMGTVVFDLRTERLALVRRTDGASRGRISWTISGVLEAIRRYNDMGERNAFFTEEGFAEIMRFGAIRILVAA